MKKFTQFPISYTQTSKISVFGLDIMIDLGEVENMHIEIFAPTGRSVVVQQYC